MTKNPCKENINERQRYRSLLFTITFRFYLKKDPIPRNQFSIEEYSNMLDVNVVGVIFDNYRHIIGMGMGMATETMASGVDYNTKC